ncbi:thioredoxin family protein [Nocardioides sp.]|uniref:thioredoxin family protein n=1 Tax=Nocardioides sp. TaxID=35761 RepID=UPI002ED7A552
MRVHVTLGYFDGCPSWQTALANLEVAAARIGADIEVELESVETLEDAERLGFTGSPTLLLDGTDPFAVPGTGPALACRVYATPAEFAASPTVDQLASVLGAHERSH